MKRKLEKIKIENYVTDKMKFYRAIRHYWDFILLHEECIDPFLGFKLFPLMKNKTWTFEECGIIDCIPTIWSESYNSMNGKGNFVKKLKKFVTTHFNTRKFIHSFLRMKPNLYLNPIPTVKKIISISDECIDALKCCPCIHRGYLLFLIYKIILEIKPIYREPLFLDFWHLANQLEIKTKFKFIFSPCLTVEELQNTLNLHLYLDLIKIIWDYDFSNIDQVIISRICNL